MDSIHIIKKNGGSLRDSYLEEGFILEKKIGVGQPKRLENPKILIANTPMDTDKIKIFGSKVRVDSTSKLAEIEETEKVIDRYIYLYIEDSSIVSYYKIYEALYSSI